MMDKDPSNNHPLGHVDSLKCYEWMLAECAALNASRQAREDQIVSSIIQISSAAILAVPGIIFATDIKIPSFLESPFLYIGLISFITAMISALAEQHYSAIAHDRHIEIVYKYYTKVSDITEDAVSRQNVKTARKFAYASFIVALITTSAAILTLGEGRGSKSHSHTVPNAHSNSKAGR